MIPVGVESGANDWRIRPAHPNDWAAGCAVVAANALTPPPLLADAAAFGEALADGGVYVATAAETVIGILGAQPIAYDGEKPYTLWVEVVAVHPAWQQRGIGTALHRALGRWAEEVGIQGVLTAHAGDPVTDALHRHIGFVKHRDDLLLWRFGNHSF